LDSLNGAAYGALCTTILAGGLAMLLSGSVTLIPAVIGALALLAAGVLVGLRLGAGRRAQLEREIDVRSGDLHQALSELEIAQAETVRRLSMAVEFRDEDTGAHIERIGRFSTLLAQQVGMEQDFNALVSHAAPLHDVGKVAIPDAILLKPGPLTPDERAIVETHAEEGHRLLKDSTSTILDLAATIALSHHEKWDGSGYPRGLAGEAIPIEGRIVAIADVFDALTSDRVYRKAFSVEQAVEMMQAQRGRHFDPVLLDAFMEVLDNTGPQARAAQADDPQTLVESVLDAYIGAIEHGDAESAEGAIMQAIEDGIQPATLHGQVFVPALGRIAELAVKGEIDPQGERLASAITRRILATLYRYMLGATEPDRERILLTGANGDERLLGLQMVHDQLAAAGYRTTIEAEVSRESLAATIEDDQPELVVLAGATASESENLEALIEDLRKHHPDIPILVGGELSPAHPDVAVLESIERSVPAVEELLAGRQH
jgi:methanogenic corrinoid protein MtbC1